MAWYTMDTYDGFLDPRTFNKIPREPKRFTVQDDGSVDCDGVKLRFTKKSFPPRTEVMVCLSQYIIGTTVLEYEEEQTLREKQRKEKENHEKIMLNRDREKSEEFNHTLNLPFSWDVGMKDVLSGLSESSAGDGKNRRTVLHIRVLEDFNGKIKRKKYDFLCTTASGSNGRQYSSQVKEMHKDGEGQDYMPKPTCKRCIELALSFHRRQSQGFSR